MSGNVVRFLPKSLMKLFDELLKAETCLDWSTAVSHKYYLYESPIQRCRDSMKSVFIPALSSKTTAHTLIECDVNLMISSLVRSGWQIFCKGLKYFGNLACRKVFCDTLVVDKDAHWLVISLTQVFCLQKDPICRTHWTYVRMPVVHNEIYLLTVLTVLLDLEG